MERRTLFWASILCEIVAWWLFMALSDVSVPEAYTLPFAALALLVGLVKGVITAAGYPQLSIAGIYFLMLLVLIFRPRGLFGERILRFE